MIQSGSYDFSEGAPRYGPPFTIFDPSGKYFFDLTFIQLLTNFNFDISDGFINTNIELEHQRDQHDRSGVAGACAAMLNGSSYIIGGYSTNRVSD